MKDRGPDWEDLPPIDYEVTCARCGKVGQCTVFIAEEGDEWECPECWERCEAARARHSAPCFGCASGLVAVDGKHYMGGDADTTGIVICECTADQPSATHTEAKP